MKQDFLQHDGMASRCPEDRRIWMYAAGKRVLGSRFSVLGFREWLRRMDPDGDEGDANWVTLGVVLLFVLMALVGALSVASSPGPGVDADDALMRMPAQAARESTLGLGLEAAARRADGGGLMPGGGLMVGGDAGGGL